MTTQQSNALMFIPPPTGGINARDPWYNMEGQYCISQTNLKPDYNFSPCRAGFYNNGQDTHVYGAQTSATNFPIRQADDTARYFITFYNGGTGQSFEQTTSGGLTALGTSSYLANACQFRDRLFIAGGNASPKDFIPGTLAATAWTIGGAGGAVLLPLATPWSYRGKLYFTYGGTANIYYGISDGIAGALTLFPLASVLTEGGYPLFGGRTQLNGDLSNQDFNVIVTSMGEIIVYSGADPGASDWQLYGRFKISSPLHAGSSFYYGHDLHIVTTQGIVAMSDVLAGRVEGANYVTISKLIDPELSAAFAYSSSLGAGYLDIGRAAISQQENLLYVSALDYSGRYSGTIGTRMFYVMNLATKAWGVYLHTVPSQGGGGGSLISNPVSNGLYVRFLTSATTTLYNWLTNQGNRDYILSNTTYYNIPWTIRTAFLSDRKLFNKKFNKFRAILEGTDYYNLQSYVDFQPTAQTHGNYTESGVTFIKKYTDINQFGTFISIYLQSYIKSTATSSQKNAFYGGMLSYEPGSNIP